MSESNIRLKSNQCLKVNGWSIVWCSIHSKIMLEFVVSRSSENLLTRTLLLFLFFNRGYYSSNLILLIFRCQKIRFLCKQNVSYEKPTQRNLYTKAKVFHESISSLMKCYWNCISLNVLKEKIHSSSLP